MADFVMREAEATAAVGEAVRAGLLAAAEHYARAVREALAQHDNEAPSLPGEAPHMQTLQATAAGVKPLSQTVEVFKEGGEVAVGTKSEYALDLERGTARVEPRPVWEKLALAEAGECGRVMAEAARDAFAGKHGK